LKTICFKKFWFIYPTSLSITKIFKFDEILHLIRFFSLEFIFWIFIHCFLFFTLTWIIRIIWIITAIIFIIFFPICFRNNLLRINGNICALFFNFENFIFIFWWVFGIRIYLYLVSIFNFYSIHYFRLFYSYSYISIWFRIFIKVYYFVCILLYFVVLHDWIN